MDSGRVPVFAGPRIIELADAARVRRLLAGRNAEAVRQRKSRRIVQVNLLNFGDDSRAAVHPRGNPRRYSHDHENPDNPRGVWKLRRLPNQDAPLYRLSVTDCFRKSA